jgi:hypothetical protein
MKLSKSMQYYARLILVFLATLLYTACTTLVIPVERGIPARVDADHGVVFGRIVLTWDVEDPLSSSAHVRAIGWQFTNQETGKQFIAPKVTREGWYVLLLPPGQYQITAFRFFHGFTGEWEGKLPATFSVVPNECVYLGTWRIRLKTLGQEAIAAAQVDNEVEQLTDDRKSTMRSCPTPARVRLMNSSSSGRLSLLQPSSGG